MKYIGSFYNLIAKLTFASAYLIMSFPGEYQDPGLDHSYAAMSAPSLSGDLIESPPSPSDNSEELPPSPSDSPVTSRAAVADLVRLVSLLNP